MAVAFLLKNFMTITISNSHTSSELNYHESQDLIKLIGGIRSLKNVFYMSRQI